MDEKDTKEHARYRMSYPGTPRRCGTCKFFEQQQDRACTRVEGTIEAHYDCDWYRDKFEQT